MERLDKSPYLKRLKHGIKGKFARWFTKKKAVH